MRVFLIFFLSIIAGVSSPGCVPRPYVRARLLDHSGGGRASSVDAGVTAGKWHIGVASDFDFGGEGGSPINNPRFGLSVGYGEK